MIFFISDLKEERKVSYQEGKEFTTKNGMLFLETSALTGYNIKEAFELMAKEIIPKISPIKEEKKEIKEIKGKKEKIKKIEKKEVLKKDKTSNNNIFNKFKNIFNKNSISNINHSNNNENLNKEIIKELESLLTNEKNKNLELILKINDLENSLKKTIDENNNLNQRIKKLEELLTAKEKDINKLNDKLSNQNKLNEIINKNKLLIEELKSKIGRYPFELLPGEKIISIIFNSTQQDINYSIICKNTDIFSNIEVKLYQEYPKYKENQKVFMVNGNMVNRDKNLEENKIKNSDVILLYPL